MDISAHHLAYGFLIGAVVGSFLNVVSLRLPRMVFPWLFQDDSGRRESLVRRSSCPCCEHRLGPLELAPVLSWLFQRGKCRACGCRISPRYPLVEIFTGLVTAFAAFQFGLGLEFWTACVFLWLLITLSMIDYEHGLLPDALTYPLLAFQSYWNLHTSLADSLIGAAAGFLSLYALNFLWKVVSRQEGMGLGDMKLFMAIGAWLGAEALAQVWSVSFIAALLFITGFVFIHGFVQSRLAFGPFIATGGAFTLLLGKYMLLNF